MRLQVLTSDNHYVLNDYTPKYNYPSVKQNEQLYYGTYMRSGNIHLIQKSTYPTVFKDNHQTYLLYLFGHNPRFDQQIEIHKLLYKTKLGITQNTFKCQSFFMKKHFYISSNFDLDLSVPSDFSFGKFTFPKNPSLEIGQYISKKQCDYYFDVKITNNIKQTFITINSEINDQYDYLSSTYCDKNYFKFPVPSAEIKYPQYKELDPKSLDVQQKQIAQLYQKLGIKYVRETNNIQVSELKHDDTLEIIPEQHILNPETQVISF